MIIKSTLQSLLIATLFVSCQSNSSKAFVPESNGNMNSVSVVMAKSAWGGSLGKHIKESLTEPYEGLPFDEPKYDLFHLDPFALIVVLKILVALFRPLYFFWLCKKQPEYNSF